MGSEKCWHNFGTTAWFLGANVRKFPGMEWLKAISLLWKISLNAYQLLFSLLNALYFHPEVHRILCSGSTDTLESAFL